MERSLRWVGGLSEGDLVAVRLPPGPTWTNLVLEVWDAGAALLPIDPRLSPTEADVLLRLARPTVLVSSSPGGSATRRPPDGIAVEPAAVLVMHTSGTDGAPKLVQFEREAIDAAVAASATALGATSRDPWICCLPLAHIGGMLVLLRGVLLGAPVTIHPSFDPAAFANRPDAAFVSVVPTMLRRLLDAEIDVAAPRALLVGGAPLAPELRERAELAGARVVETYGSTESCGGVVYEGRPLPGVEMRVDADGGIALRGPMTMLGYRFDAEATARAIDAEGWLRTGDVGEIDPQGRLQVAGRLDDLIVTGGEKVWPQEVEAALRGHAKVSEVAVAARPDAEWGQRVVAVVVPSDPARPPTLGELRDFAVERVGRHKAPRELVLVDELPRTPSGKLRRPVLARDETGIRSGYPR